MCRLIQKEREHVKRYMLKRDRTNSSLVALTVENVARAEAMIASNFIYARAANPNAQPVVNGGNAEYIGSTAFWMTHLNQALRSRTHSADGYFLREIIAGAIAAIDNENSTRLTTNGVGRIRVWETICGFIDTQGTTVFRSCLRERRFDLFHLIAQRIEPESLTSRRRLNRQYRQTFAEHPWLFKEIKASEEDKEYTPRQNPSFASKFCHYAAFWLFKGQCAQDGYSIYDTIVREALPGYLERYGIPEIPSDDLKNYETYCQAIDAIRDQVAQTRGGKLISRNGFDHLLWYFHKTPLDNETED